MADARKLEGQLEPVPSPELHDESADPRLRDLIYRAGSVIRLRGEDADWVWDVFIRVQDGDETRLGGLPTKPGELYPLLVMENLGRSASRFLIASMCARACAAGAIVTTETTELFDELQALIADVTSNGVVEANIKYGLDKKLRWFWDAAQNQWPLTGQTRLLWCDGRRLQRAVWRPAPGQLRLR